MRLGLPFASTSGPFPIEDSIDAAITVSLSAVIALPLWAAF